MGGLLVCYAVAHSGSPGQEGARTDRGVTERAVAEAAVHGMKSCLESNGCEVRISAGSLHDKLGRIKHDCGLAQQEGRPWCAVSLHCNSTPLELCHVCGAESRKGGKCPQCGAPSSTGWRFGHTALVSRQSQGSMDLAVAILEELGDLLPWSTQRPLIRTPDSKYAPDAWPNTLLWPRLTPPPAVLVEAGFMSDPRFAAWIEDPAHQATYGLVVAEGILRWYDKRKPVLVQHWHE